MHKQYIINKSLIDKELIGFQELKINQSLEIK